MTKQVPFLGVMGGAVLAAQTARAAQREAEEARAADQYERFNGPETAPPLEPRDDQ